jgi:sec-independent protein translocase protein TatC
MASKPSAIRGARIVGERYVREKRQENPEGRMPLMDHLRELRNRIVKATIAIAVGMILALVFSDQTWNYLTGPFCRAKIEGHTGCKAIGDTLIATNIFDPLTMRIEVAFYVALIVTCPIWFYQLWAFIAPGLYSREKKWAYIFTGTAVPLFLAGAVLAYEVMDRGLYYLLGLAPHGVEPFISADSYMSYFFGMLVGFGIVFELPLVIIMLNVAGILTHERFRKWRRVLIFGIFLIAGIVNPSPDPTTMLILGGIAVGLTEAAELFVFFNDKRRARLNPSPYADLADDELSPIEDPEPIDADNSR